MELLTPREVRIGPDHQVYRESPLACLKVAIVLALVCVGGVILFLSGLLPSRWAGLIGLVSGLGAWVFYVGFVRARTPANWLMVVGDEAIMIRFRYFRNTALPRTDKQVVSLSFSEIESVQITEEKVRTRGVGRTTLSSFKYLDLRVNCPDLDKLVARLKYEIGVRARSKIIHYPVSVHENTVRVLWNGPGTGIAPKVERCVELLASRDVPVDARNSERHDYTNLVMTTLEEAKPKIVELIERGMEFEAEYVLQSALKLDTMEADRFVRGVLKEMRHAASSEGD